MFQGSDRHGLDLDGAMENAKSIYYDSTRK